MSSLRLIFGDQLSLSLASLKDTSKDDLIVLMEIKPETEYVPHHKRKLVFLFSAMRHFSEELKDAGYNTHYIKLDSPNNHQSFCENLRTLVNDGDFTSLELTEVGEYRLQEEILSWESKLEISVIIHEDSRFFLSRKEFSDYAKDRKNLLMEHFYRMMRQKTGYLMHQGKPLGGKWNYDAKNRNKYDHKVEIPKRLKFSPDQITKEVISLIEKEFTNNFGSTSNFHEAINRKQALQCLDIFCDQLIHQFGKYQDAMLNDEALLFHSRISHYINCGLLIPSEVCARVLEVAIECDQTLYAVEGFIRQIIGWREYVRGIYWLNMPKYVNLNFFNANNPLPSFYWDGKTDMNCVSTVVQQTYDNAYSHHIQRLMITGNLALLMGITPAEVHEWYLAVYDDAYEWVELPNTMGMALFADGGVMASKPYAASGNYINKMSDFCKSCKYKVKEKNGSDACPFNYLYWDFLERNKDKLKSNHRLFMPYRNLEKKNTKDIDLIKNDSNRFITKHCSK